MSKDISRDSKAVTSAAKAATVTFKVTPPAKPSAIGGPIRWASPAGRGI